MEEIISFKASKLVSIDDLDIEDIYLLFNTTLEFEKVLNRPLKKVPALKDKTIANVFFEDQPLLSSTEDWNSNHGQVLVKYFGVGTEPATSQSEFETRS